MWQKHLRGGHSIIFPYLSEFLHLQDGTVRPLYGGTSGLSLVPSIIPKTLVAGE